MMEEDDDGCHPCERVLEAEAFVENVCSADNLNSINRPKVVRQVLCDIEIFGGQARDWQIGVLYELRKRFRSHYDVVRFITGEPGSETNICEHLALRLIDLLDSCTDDEIRSRIVVLLARIVSVGTTLKVAKKIFIRTANARRENDSKLELEFLHLLLLSVQQRVNPLIDRCSKNVALCYFDAANIPLYYVQDLDEPNGPETYISCIGPGSWIDFGKIESWPFRSEYCLWMWIRIEDDNCDCTLFRTRNEENLGVSISLIGNKTSGYSFVVEATDRKAHPGITKVAVPPELLRPRTWHQITVSHITKYIGSSQMKIIIDGTEIKLIYAIYPGKIVGEMSMRAFENFNGQIATFFVLCEAPTATQTLALLNAHQQFETQRRGLQRQWDGISFSPGILSGRVDRYFDAKVFLHLHPSCADGDLLIDLYNGRHGQFNVDTMHVWRELNIRDLLSQLGGISMMLHFVWHRAGECHSSQDVDVRRGACLIHTLAFIAQVMYDHPQNQLDFFHQEGAALTGGALQRLDRSVLLGACSLERSLIRKSVAEYESASTMCYAIKCLLSTESSLVAAMLVLYGSALTWPITIDTGTDTTRGVLARDYNDIVHALDTHIFFNISLIGRCCDPDDKEMGSVPQEWIQFLNARGQDNPGLLKRFVEVQSVLDSLRDFYRYKFSIKNQKGLYHLSNATIQLGTSVARLLIAMMTDFVTLEDATALVNCCIGAGRGADLTREKSMLDKDTLVDITGPGFWVKNTSQWSLEDICMSMDCLFVLANLLGMDSPPHGLVEACTKLGGPSGFPMLLILNVVQCCDIGETLQATSLQCIHEYLKHVNVDTVEGGGALQIARSFITGPTMPVPTCGVIEMDVSKGYQQFASSGGIGVLAHSLSINASTRHDAGAILHVPHMSAIYGVLLDVMVKNQNRKRYRSYADSVFSALSNESGSISRTMDDDSTAEVEHQTLLLDDTSLIANGYILWIVLKLLPRFDIDLLQRVCQDLFLLLKFQRCNQTTLIRIPGWEGALLTMMGSLEAMEDTQVCYDMGVKLFLLVLQNSLLTEPGGYVRIEVVLSIAPVTVSGMNIILSMLTQLFQQLGDVLDKEVDILGTSEQFLIVLRNFQGLVRIMDTAIAKEASNEIIPGVVASILGLSNEFARVPVSMLPDKIRELAPGRTVFEIFCGDIEDNADDLTGESQPKGSTALSMLNLCIRALDCGNVLTGSILTLLTVIRGLPPSPSTVQWALDPAKEHVKGERSAVLVKLFCSIHRQISVCRLSETYQKLDEYKLILGEMVDLYPSIFVKVLSEEYFMQLQSIPKSNGFDWVCFPLMIEPIVSETFDVDGDEPCFGIEGAIRALRLRDREAIAAWDDQLKERWEAYFAAESLISNTKLRTHLEVSARETIHNLAYSELSRLSSRSMVQHEEQSDILQEWLKLTTDSESNASVWYEASVITRWMVSPRECSWRRRIMLVKNHAFEDHASAVNWYQDQDIRHESDHETNDLEMEKIGLLLRPMINHGEGNQDENTGAEEGNNFGDLSDALSNDDSEMAYGNLGSLAGSIVPCDLDLTLPDDQIQISISRVASSDSNSVISDSDERRKSLEPCDASVSSPTPSESRRTVMMEDLDLWSQQIQETSGFRREQFILGKNENLVHVCKNAQWITPLQTLTGRIEISTKHIYFYAEESKRSTRASTCVEPEWVDHDDTFVGDDDDVENDHDSSSDETKQMMRWTLTAVYDIHGRRYLLRETALEIFLMDMTTIFLCFPSVKDRSDCYSAILKQQTPNLDRSVAGKLLPKTVFNKSKITERWQRREISNFEYLMKLNTIAGRSYNDVNQYPVFPWVISDYVSEELDLEDSRVYRDLTKPVGALNPERLDDILERYQHLKDAVADIPAFHYGSHYSNAGIVLHYLLRMEPFTTMGIEFQGGRFDCPDRLFYSVQDCWKSSMQSVTDVKELIPEFYFCPEMFLNLNRFKFGSRQGSEGTDIDHVILPPWAKNSAYEFVRILREALESDYVSENLHHWIDLIFGYKQRGVEAEKANNIFYYLTYEGAIDLDSIADPVQRYSIETQIAHFGQTPSQLLDKPHPKRHPRGKVFKEVKPLPNFDNMHLHARDPVQTVTAGARSPRIGGGVLSRILSHTADAAGERAQRIVYVTCAGDKLIIVFESLHASIVKYSRSDIGYLNLKYFPLKRLGGWPKVAKGFVDPAAPFMRMHLQSFASCRATRTLLSCNYWDNSVQMQNLDTNRTEISCITHRNRAICLDLCEEGSLMAVGSIDGSVSLWRLGASQDMTEELMEFLGKQESTANIQQSMNVISKFYGHVSPVTSVAVSRYIGIVVSGSLDGKVLVFSLHDRSCLRELPNTQWEGPVTQIKIAPVTGNIFVYVARSCSVSVFSANGAPIVSKQLPSEVTCLEVGYVNFVEMEFIVVGMHDGSIQFRRSNDLSVLSRVTLPEEQDFPTSLSISPCLRYVFVGTNDGKLIAVESV